MLPHEKECMICGSTKKTKPKPINLDGIPVTIVMCISCAHVNFFLNVDISTRKEVPIDEIPLEVRKKLGL